MHETILVLNFGAQYVQLIARRVRECGVYSQIVPFDITADEVRRLNPQGLIFSGGPSSVNDENPRLAAPALYELGIPILGICYGMQNLAAAFNGTVQSAGHREYGRAALHLTPDGETSPLFRNTPKNQQVWMSHGDRVTRLPADFTILGTSESSPICAVKHKTKDIYGVQYHPEVVHSPFGQTIIGNFVKDICTSRGDWSMKNFAAETIERLRNEIGNDQVICGLSGGVDSAVVAAILSKAIGKRLKCILVDNGLLRRGEAEAVRTAFEGHFDIDLHTAGAADEFFADLAGITEPQEKRRRIGHRFIDVFAQAAKEFNGAKYLAQGTIYPDIIESGQALHQSHTSANATIKLHHNVGGLPEKLGFQLVEPLRELFKDEVRQLGIELGLPEDFVWRHPFPGPGLAVRCIGEVTREKIERVRQADAVVIEEIRCAGLYRSVSQVFAVLLPVKSVGVMGDGRTYEDAVAVRCVTTDDFMTADWSPLPDEVLRKISTRIINEVKGVNRVVYDISSKPPATIEWE
ncbi:MAG: glutamine-hydrolyzing GMP synthase [Planctomycetaceae bacterium]|jgi:GMP synthase (glutamine-hydrolysing)|nr:glutamine-hydrolyzing GMP synthase [Planctomycetaceae bacterium]